MAKENMRPVLEKKNKPFGENSSLSFCFPESYKPRYFIESVDVYRMCDNKKDTKHMKALLDYFKQDATVALWTHRINVKIYCWLM